jgi:hypothetical protein
MHKIIHSTFEFDLTPYGVSIVEDNYWFTDNFFTKYSFPFNFKLNEQLLATFGDLLDDNSKFIENKYNVVYVFGNQLENAIFEIESQIGEDIEATFRFGFDEFPLWDKKIRDFNFPTFATSNIYDYAKGLLHPGVAPPNNPPLEFPAIIANKYDTEELTWQTFLGIINNYNTATSEYIVNTNLTEDFANRNIMQPCLYLYYVLDTCFSEAGYDLKGDIINNNLFLRMLLYASVDYFKRVAAEEFKIQIGILIAATETATAFFYDLDYPLSDAKKYKITGDIFITKPLQSSSTDYYLELYYNDVLIDKFAQPSQKSRYIKKNINLIIETAANDAIAHTLTVKISDYKYNQPGNRQFLADLTVAQIIDGADAVPDEIENENTLNLNKALPDVTFGELVEETTRIFNLDKSIIGREIHFNFIDDQINYRDAVDLSNFCVLKPKKTLNKNPAYILKYKDNSEDLGVVYADKEEVLFTDTKVTTKTKKIEFSSSILPFQFKDNSFTVVDKGEFADDKIYFILYDNLRAKAINSNLPQESSALSPFNIYQEFYQNWLNFLFQAISYEWIFKMYDEQILKIKNKVFAYGRYHIVKSIDKTQISEDLFEIEIETETLP